MPSPSLALFLWCRRARAGRLRSSRIEWRSEGLQIFDELLLLLARERQLELPVVVVDDGRVVREAPVVVEAALRPHEQALERRRPVEVLVGRAARLEVVDADLLRPVHRPAGLREERRHVAARALRLSLEDEAPT